MTWTVDGGRLTKPAIFAALFLCVACRTSRLPDEQAIPPLNAATPEAAMSALRDRMGKLIDVHALVRVRIATAERTDTFKASVTVANPRQMELTVFTPLNTTAATITSNGNTVKIRDVIHGTTVTTTTQQLAENYGIFIPHIPPSDMALLLLGFPSVRDATYEATPTGLRRAVVGDVTINYEPPVQPVQSVKLTRPGQTVEMTVLEAVGR